MGWIIFAAIGALIACAAGGVAFGLLSLIIFLAPIAKKGWWYAGAGIIGFAVSSITVVWLGYATFADNPGSNFQNIFGRKPPAGLTVVRSNSSVGPDYNDAVIHFRIEEKNLRDLIAAWKPGAVGRGAMPGHDGLKWDMRCKENLYFFNEVQGHHLMEYSAVMYCRDDKLAQAVYSSLD